MGTLRLAARNLTADDISEAADRAAQGKCRVEVSDQACPGLEFGVSPAGVKTWSLRVRDPAGRLRRFRVGSYPEKTPTAARKAANVLRVQVEGGYDPVAQKRAKRIAGAELRAGIGTLAGLLDLYAKQGIPPKTWWSGAGRKRIERVFADLLTAPIAEMKASDIIRAADAYGGKQAAAGNAIRALSPVLRWAVHRDYAPAALSTIRPGVGVPKRDRVLSSEELRRVLPVLRSGDPPYGTAMLFMLLTLARRQEAADAIWAEMDLEQRTWTIPPERQKNTRRSRNRKPLVVPLSWQAVQLLRWVSRKEPKPQRHELIFQTASGSPLGNWDRAQQQIFRASNTSSWHRHDLRRTSATVLGEAGVPPFVIEAALNHATIHSDLAGRYNHARYREDVKDALQRLAAHYDVLASRWMQEEDTDPEHGDGEVEWRLRLPELGEAPPCDNTPAAPPELPVI